MQRNRETLFLLFVVFIEEFWISLGSLGNSMFPPLIFRISYQGSSWPGLSRTKVTAQADRLWAPDFAFVHSFQAGNMT